MLHWQTFAQKYRLRKQIESNRHGVLVTNAYLVGRAEDGITSERKRKTPICHEAKIL
jgi:hypothetical protein